jgi:hypothetical protein
MYNLNYYEVLTMIVFFGSLAVASYGFVSNTINNRSIKQDKETRKEGRK